MRQQELLSIFGLDTNNRQRECCNRILRLGNGNSATLIDYAQAYKRGNPGIASSTLTMYLLNLVRFAEYVNKPFADMTSDDILRYLDSFSKSEKEDPNQRWKGMYNLFRVIVTYFFKWFYAPDIISSDRPKPAIVANLRNAKPKGGKKRKRYGLGDMWTLDDNEVFFKYCPDPRIIGYHALAIDTGARPHELLKLKIEDIIWPPDGSPPKFILNGKTVPRTVCAMRYHRYVKYSIEQHPKHAIPSSILFYSKKTDGILNGNSLYQIYVGELKPYFHKLLDTAIGQEDRKKITHLLKKPWNPNVLRHTTATEFSSILSDADAKQFFGWSADSNMPSNYRHYFGDEATKKLMIEFGIKTQQKQLPKFRECPNVTCKEPNIPDAPFCAKCRVPLTVAGHIEQGHQKEREISALREQTQILSKQLADVIEQQQHANTFDMKFIKLLDIVKTGLVDQDETTRSFISEEIVKMMHAN